MALKTRKGVIFTLDSIISVGLVIALIGFMGIYFSITPEIRYRNVYSNAEDSMQLLSKLTVRDVQPKVQDLIDDKFILEEDYNKTIIELIGTFWVSGNSSQAANLTRKILDNVTKCYELTILENINESTIYKSCQSYGDNIAIATRLASGIEKGKILKGYISRAWATKTKKNSSAVFGFDPEGAGNAGTATADRLVITKRFKINATQIFDGKLFILIHSGQNNIHASSQFLVNGIDYTPSGNICPGGCSSVGNGGQMCCINETDKGGNTLAFYKGNISGDLKAGWNNIGLSLGKPATGDSTHLHPGSRIEATYYTDEEKLITANVNQSVFFDDIKSPGKNNPNQRGGVWAVMPVNIPKGAEVQNATIHLYTINSDGDATERAKYDGVSDVMVYFNSTKIFAKNVTGSRFNVSIDITKNITTTSESNVITVYIDTYNEDFWGSDTKTVTLYSNMQANETNSSRIELVYKAPSSLIKYGFVDVTKVENFKGPYAFPGGNNGNPKSYNFSFANFSVYQTFIHVLQLDSENVTINVTPKGEPSLRVFRSPMPGATPSSIYADPTYFNATKNNTITMKDDCNDKCDFLNESSFEYTVYIPAQVGYGDVFENQSAADEDAKKRLNETIKNYLDAISVDLDLVPTGVGGIPGLWGPATFTLRAWD